MGLLKTLLREPEEKPIKDASPASSSSWLCPHCGRPATIEDVDSSLDGQRTLTFWSCKPCDLAAVTPDAIRLPPLNWIKRTEQ
jgi:hypothetical protein